MLRLLIERGADVRRYHCGECPDHEKPGKRGGPAYGLPTDSAANCCNGTLPGWTWILIFRGLATCRATRYKLVRPLLSRGSDAFQDR